MKRSVKLGLIVLGLLVVPFIVSAAKGSFASPDMSLVSYVQDVIRHQYVEKDVDEDKLVYGAIQGMLASLEDPYTRFMPPKNYKEMKVRMAGEFSGIGIHIGIRDDRLTVISPIFGTPAHKVGLKAMDKIMTIDGESTDDLGLSEAVSKIRGPKGEPVVLGILSLGDESTRDVEIIRDTIKISSIEKKEVFKDKIGYLKLATFESQKSTTELRDGFEELKATSDAMILDLRDNGGGLLRNAINMASFFMEEGDVVHTVGRDGDRTTRSVTGGAFYDKPLVILINQGSASASEILAGAIKDNGRGLVVGDRSFGKASVQNVLPLKDGSAVLYTIAKYLTPKGTDITKSGITPNIEVKLATEDLKAYYDPSKYSYESDEQLQKAIQTLLDQL